MPKIEKECLYCKSLFTVYASAEKRRPIKYCSWRCRFDIHRTKIKCSWCKKEFVRTNSRIKEVVKRNKTRMFFCSKECQLHIANFKGGGIHRGYKFIRGRPEHRIVMEQYLKRKLEKKEHIHHINHNKLDNRIENLQLLSIWEHGALEGKRGGRPTSTRTCTICINKYFARGYCSKHYYYFYNYAYFEKPTF